MIIPNRAIINSLHPQKGLASKQPETLTLIRAVCVRFIAVVPTVVIPVTGPIIRDASATVALELSTGARVTAARLVTVVPTVII